MENKEDKTLGLSNASYLEKLYDGWYLDYASYVILERAVPYFEDGLKPVQRRILHTLFDMHDGRYHKVANIVGRTMQLHPHGDQSIGDALVNMGQKDLLIDTQGNWGNPFTGDRAAASRYIEGRLTPFALEVLFNPETTHWIPSYDGRNNEPVTLPVKFPLLLAQGVEGIAVGLSTTILPHNFCELCEASIAHLRGKKFDLFPDFFTGGSVDVSDYNDGLRGGRIKVRAKIEKLDARRLVIKEIPFGTTTGSLIDSIIKANERGRIKIKHVDDNTSSEVEIVVHLHAGVDSQMVIDALYAFTDCEKSLAPNSCIIVNKKPKFIGVSEILKLNTDHTVRLLKWELENKLAALEQRWHMTSLEKIFIEKEVYEVIKKSQNKEEMIQFIEKGLSPYIHNLRKPVSTEEIQKLAEIPIRRISRFDRKKADELLENLDTQIAETHHHLTHLTEYAIQHFKNILKKYGKGLERKTEITELGKVNVVHVAMNNQKLYVNRKEGFLGTGLRREEYLFDVSDYDDIIIFKNDGSYKVVRVSDKVFVGKNIIHIEKFNKDNERLIYNVIYQEGKSGTAYIKRFNVGGITRDRDYQMGRGKPGSKILYFSSNPNGEAEVVEVLLKPRPRIKLNFEVDFSQTEIKGRNAIGNQVTKHPIRTIKRVRKGTSTLGAKILYFDAPSGVISSQKKGESLGEFENDDKILVVKENGIARVHDIADPLLIGSGILHVQKYNPDQIYSILYFEGANFSYMVKRFKLDNCPTTTEFSLLSEHPDTKLMEFLSNPNPQVLVEFQIGKKIEKETLSLNEISDIRGYKALGSKFTAKKIINTSKIEEIIQKESEENIDTDETTHFEMEEEKDSVDLFE